MRAVNLIAERVTLAWYGRLFDVTEDPKLKLLYAYFFPHNSYMSQILIKRCANLDVSKLDVKIAAIRLI